MEGNSLKEIEEIKKLKARYFRLMDTKCWEEWAELFAEDGMIEVVQKDAEICWQGRERIVANNSEALRDVITVHHGHMPEIDLTGATTATGIWAMFDFLIFPNGTVVKGYGHYHEEYVKESGQWRIKSIRLTRLYVDYSTQG